MTKPEVKYTKTIEGPFCSECGDPIEMMPATEPPHKYEIWCNCSEWIDTDEGYVLKKQVYFLK